MLNYKNESLDVIADWLELSAIAFDGVPLSVSKAKEIAADYAQIQTIQIEQAFNKLKARSQKLGEKYPFNVTADYVLAVTGAEHTGYGAMLIVSPMSPGRNQAHWSLDSAAKLFELVAENCLRSFFGDGTRTANFGHPSTIGRPPEFNLAVQWIANKLNVKVGSGYRQPRRKDGGVDIFVWKEFADKNPGTPLILIQCTIQKQFTDKVGDVDLKLWSSWLSSDLDPMVGLCVSDVVVKSEIWDEITTRGLLLDRMRLISMQIEEPHLSPAEQAFINQVLAGYKEDIK
jgi:hypothetical protein